MRKLVSATLIAASIAAAPSPARGQQQPPPFDWNGPYVGVGFGVFGLSGPIGIYAPAALVGFNIRQGRLLASVEAHAEIGFPGPVFELDIAGRLGVLIGYRDRGVYYAEAGIGYAYGAPAWLVGVGHEFAINEAMTVFGEVKAYLDFTPSPRGMAVQIGLNWHPGN